MSKFDLLWLLLPVAASAGWFAARLADSRSNKAFWDYTSDFHRGLNVLLSDQEEKPVELFSSVSGTDRDTAETHIALGNHFRGRGDMARAVLMHRSVINNKELDDEVRAAAQFELAMDFDSAGLSDRSEAEFQALITAGYRVYDTYQSLLLLHERESDWPRAIDVAVNAERDTGEPCGWRIAHYHCEQAELARKQKDLEGAEIQLRQAIGQHATCVRALAMQADLALETGEPARAIALYEQVEALRPELIPVIIEKRFDAFSQAGDEKRLESFLRRIQTQRNAYSVIRSARSVITQRYDSALADRFFKEQILKRPSLKGLRDWAHDQLELSKPDERAKVQVICDLLDKVIEDKAAYCCKLCGFQGNVMHWRCPQCGQWDSVSTIVGVEGE